MHGKKKYTGGDSNPHTLHAELSALISVDWARFQSLYILSLIIQCGLPPHVHFCMAAAAYKP